MQNGITDIPRKPHWLNKRIDFKKCRELELLLAGLHLHTVCQEALCPNMSECFHAGVATFLILGDVCTRGCRFCAIKKGIAQHIDPTEPLRIAEAVDRLQLKHVVITSVTRDDLPDGGAGAFAQTIKAIRKLGKEITIEALIPDFQGNRQSLSTVIHAGCDILAHNLETVPSLYQEIRPGADYTQSLEILDAAKQISQSVYIKSGIMLGLGEIEEEVLQVFSDLRRVCCDFLSIGQYLAPSRNHAPVKAYISPEYFSFYEKQAYSFGFRSVKSSSYVRSSYLAEHYIQEGVAHA